MKNELAAPSKEDLWGPRAGDYESMFVHFSTAAATAGLEQVQAHGIELRAGTTLLDVGAGTGALTLQAAATGARVTAIDQSAAMLAVLQDKVNQEADVEPLVMDGAALRFEDQSFDLSASNFGVVHFPDPGIGLREMHRVLRDGGHTLVTAVARPRESTLMQTILCALDTVMPRRESMPAAPYERLSDSTGLIEALNGAGFRDVSVTTRTLPWEIDDPREFWRRWGTTAPPVAALFSNLPADLVATAGLEFERLLDESRAHGRAVFDTDVLIAIGSR